MSPNEFSFNIYGCSFRLFGPTDSAVKNIAKDFQFFTSVNPSKPTVIELKDQSPPYDHIPDGIATTYTPRNTSFTKNGITYIDYSGKALAIWDRNKAHFQLFTKNQDLQYEVTYLFMLSRIGECLDQSRLHRIHAMAMAVRGKAVLAILPMGGGKSTLGSKLFSYQEFDFLSDDSPFIARDGSVYAFPLRLGLLPDSDHDIPPEMLRTIERMEFGPKNVVDYEYFAHRIIPKAEPGIVFLGHRSLAEKCRIEPAPRREAYKSILANCVVGVGLFQGLEFVLNHSVFELAAKTGIACSRWLNAKRLFDSSEVYRLILGRDLRHNAETVRRFVSQRLK